MIKHKTRLFRFCLIIVSIFIIFVILLLKTEHISVSEFRNTFLQLNSSVFGDTLQRKNTNLYNEKTSASITSNYQGTSSTKTSSVSTRTNVTLVVVISTAANRRERRDAIRRTYWRYCYSYTQIQCFFFTDGNVTNNVYRELEQENHHNKDMIFQPLSGGREFGLRFLYQIQWAMSHFNFKYFLRADDDYFICLNKLIYELEYRPKENLVWGYFYCKRDLVYVDEAWMVFTRDIIERFVSQNKITMLCHPHADQQIALWLNDIPSRLYFDDKRLHHYPRASQTKQFDNATNICDWYLGIHGAFGNKMLQFDKVSNDNKKEKVPKIKDFESSCTYKGFNWTEMGGHYKFEPKPCIDKPNWSLGHTNWKGAEEGQW